MFRSLRWRLSWLFFTPCEFTLNIIVIELADSPCSHQSPSQSGHRPQTLDGWLAILKVATVWSCESLREWAIATIDNRLDFHDTFYCLNLALKHMVPKWALLAYNGICRRSEHLSVDEGRKLGWERFIAICRIREQLATGTLVVPAMSYSYLDDLSQTEPVMKTSDLPVNGDIDHQNKLKLGIPAAAAASNRLQTGTPPDASFRGCVTAKESTIQVAAVSGLEILPPIVPTQQMQAMPHQAPEANNPPSFYCRRGPHNANSK